MAKTKVDAEALKKNGFWIGLCAFALLWVIALVIVLFAGDTQAKADYEKSKKDIVSAKSTRVKTPAYQEPWKKHGEKFKKLKDDAWQKAWDLQKGMYDWPKTMAFVPQYPEDVWVDDLDNRSRFKDKYLEQFDTLKYMVAPVELSGGIDAIVPKQQWVERPPTREEIWLVQEDFWVRRELLKAVRDALNNVAMFQSVDLPKEEPKDDKVIRKVFRSRTWELDLRFEPAKKNPKQLSLSNKSTIKNITATRQTMPLANPKTGGELVFLLTQGSALYPISVGGEPLQHGLSVPIKTNDVDLIVSPVVPTKDFKVFQSLEWEMSPVRRIDGIQLGAHSHRTIVAGLTIREDLKKLDPEPEGDPQAASGGAGGFGAGGAGGAPPAMEGGRGGGAPPPGFGGGDKGGMGSAASGDVTAVNKIDRSRYMHVKPQARHLPLAIRLVVEQASLNDVMTAITNSRLRIQITQANIHHLRDVKRGEGKVAGGDKGTGEGGYGAPPPSMGATFGGGDGRDSGGSGDSQPFFIPGRGAKGYGGAAPGPMGGKDFGGGFKTGTGKDDRQLETAKEGNIATPDTSKLVELSLYGIATLYERPPRPKAEGEQPATQPKN